MKKSLLSSGIKLSLLTMASRIFGLVREMTKASFLGTSDLADAFGVAFLIPNLFRRLFAENSISVAFIPTFRSYIEKNAKEETQEFLSAVCTVSSFFTTALVLTGMLFTPFIVPFFLPETAGSATGETILLTRIMLPYLAVISVAAFFQGILNTLKIFSPSGFTPILFNICVIGGTYLFSRFTQNAAQAMSIGVIIGGAAQMLFQIPFVLKTGWKVSITTIRKALKNEGVKRVIKLVAPTIVGMAAYQINEVISTALAGHAGVGIVSSLQYSLRLQELFLGVFAVTIGTILLPDLSSYAQKNQWNEFTKTFSQALSLIALITIPVTFYALLNAEAIISLIYKSNNFSDESVTLTAQAFFYHIAGLFFIALNRIIPPAFYAQGNTKSPTIAGIIGFAVNIAVASLLVHTMKGNGIALALSVASLANTIALFCMLQKKTQTNIRQILHKTGLYAIKLILLSLVALAPLYFLNDRLFALFAGNGRIISYGIPIALSAAFYGIIGIALLVLTKDPLLASLKNMRRRNK